MDPIPIGKIPAGLLARLLASIGPAPDGAGVVLGPGIGEDACGIALGGGVLVMATDPVTLTGTGAGRLAVLVNANDVAACGVRPRWFLATALLPPGTSEAEVEALFAEVAAAAGEVGATLVGGHTEVTPAVRQPVVVGQMVGFAPDGRIVRTGGGRPGDVLVQIGPAPVEGAAVLADSAHPGLDSVPSQVLRAAAEAVRDPGVSVVEAALTATDLGATSLHDPTEGGLLGALWEVAEACGLAVSLRTEGLLLFEPGVAVCRAVGADPLATLASGCVLAAYPPEIAASAIADLAGHGFAAAEIGLLEAGAGVHDQDGRPLPAPARDEVARLADQAGAGRAAESA